MSTIIGIAGPSASGKSTICDQLQKRLENSIVIHTDNYWCNPEHFPRVKEFKNWELPECLDFDTLYTNLKELKAGKMTRAPQWVLGVYPPLKKEIKPAAIIIVEGFRLWYDARIRKLLDLKIYIDVPEEVILKRRGGRLRHPGKLNRELYYREIVVPEDRKYGLPTKKYADIVIDGTKPVLEIVGEIIRAIQHKITSL